ncbi:MAG: hypothetical protein WCW31_01360 [Patescibacteria group bacterium]
MPRIPQESDTPAGTIPFFVVVVVVIIVSYCFRKHLFPYEKGIDECQVIDLPSNKKFVGFTAVPENPNAIHLATRPMREDEVDEPVIVIEQVQNHTTKCLCIIREHALPATSASK